MLVIYNQNSISHRVLATSERTNKKKVGILDKPEFPRSALDAWAQEASPFPSRPRPRKAAPESLSTWENAVSMADMSTIRSTY